MHFSWEGFMSVLFFNKKMHKDETACLVSSVFAITFLYHQFPTTVTTLINS